MLEVDGDATDLLDDISASPPVMVEGGQEPSRVSFAEDEPSQEATREEIVAAAMEAEAVALAAKMEKKKSKLQAMLARKQAREEAERRQQELQAKLNQEMITASVQLLTFTKAFFGLIEVFPRQQCVVPCTGRGAGGSGEEEGEDEITRHEGIDSEDGGVTKLVMTPSFLIHGVETLLARLGILLQKRVGPGGFVAVERHRTVLSRTVAEYPKDVVALMLDCLKLFVVPPSFAKTDKLPFNFTVDDDVWERVSASTREWLTLVQVDEELFDVEEYRLLLDRLSAYHLPRLTRVVRMLTRDLVTVYAGAHTAKSVLALDDDVTKTIHHHGAPQSHLHRTARAPLTSAATAAAASPASPQPASSVLPADELPQDFMLGSEAKAMRPCSSGSSRVEGGGLTVSSTPLRNHKSKDSTAAHSPTAGGAQPLVRSGPAAWTLHSSSLDVVPAHEICAKGVETPLRFSDYTRLAPANYVALSRDGDVLLGAQTLTYGVNNTEPPVPQTQCRSVLHLPHSHFLGTVRELPHPNPATASVKSLTMPKQNAAGKPRKQDARRLFHEALATHVKSNGTVRIADAASVSEHAKRRGQQLSLDEKEALMYSLPDGPKLVEAQRSAAHTAGHRLRKKPVAGSQRSTTSITLPLPSAAAQDERSAGASESSLSHHLVLPLDSELLQRALATECVSPSSTGRHSPKQGLTQQSGSSSMPQPRHHGHFADAAGPSSPRSMRDAMTPPCLRNVFLTTSQRETRRVRSIALADEQHSPHGTAGASNAERDANDSQRSQLPKPRATAAVARTSPKYSTLLSLVGKSRRAEGETLTEFWERLQGLEFKLSVLRGSGSSMPPHERQLWQELWTDCHQHIEEVFVILKHQALSKRPVHSAKMPSPSVAERPKLVPGSDPHHVGDGGVAGGRAREAVHKEMNEERANTPCSRGTHDDGSHALQPLMPRADEDGNQGDLWNSDAQQLAAELTCSVVDESIRLHLVELQEEYRRRFEEGLASARADNNTTTTFDEQASERSRGNRTRYFASPIVRTYRRSALDKLFDEHGVQGLQMWLDRSKGNNSGGPAAEHKNGRPDRGGTERSVLTESHGRIAAPNGGGLVRRSGHLQPLSNIH